MTDRHDIFDAHIVPKLNENDVKFFFDVNTTQEIRETFETTM